MTIAPGEDDIALIEVSKNFRLGVIKQKQALRNLTLSVPRGQIVGLLGPNGSGKSTTLKLVLGFLRPTSGEILVCGRPSTDRSARAFIGYLPENPRFQRFLGARDVLRYYGHLLGLDGAALDRRVAELLELVGLSAAADERVQGFSKGMTQRLAVAQALLNRPRLLVFDEPMSGLDPLGRMEIRKLILRIHDEMPGSTIFFSTHVLTDVETVCSHVALLRDGELAASCSVAELLTGRDQRFEVLARSLAAGPEGPYRDRGARETPAGLAIPADGVDDLMGLLADLRRRGAVVVGVSSERRSLEQALFAGTGPVLPAGEAAPKPRAEAG